MLNYKFCENAKTALIEASPGKIQKNPLWKDRAWESSRCPGVITQVLGVCWQKRDRKEPLSLSLFKSPPPPPPPPRGRERQEKTSQNWMDGMDFDLHSPLHTIWFAEAKFCAWICIFCIFIIVDGRCTCGRGPRWRWRGRVCLASVCTFSCVGETCQKF